MNAFITSHLYYAPVVWMFHNSKQKHCINRIHERALRVVYKDHGSLFNELFKSNSCTIHDINLQKRVTDFFKIKMK